MDSAQHIVKLGPTAVELVDRTMIELARANPAFRPVIESALIGEPEAILLVEFAGADNGAAAGAVVAARELMGDARPARQRWCRSPTTRRRRRCGRCARQA